MKLTSILHFVIGLSCSLVFGRAQVIRTATLYDVGSNGFITSNVSISPQGVDAQGATIYSFDELKTVTVTVNGVPTVTLSEVWAGTLVEDASRELLTVLPTSIGGRGVIASCTYGSDAMGACIWKEWISGGSTIMYTFAGGAYPFYTVTLTSALSTITSASGSLTPSSGTKSRSHVSIGPIVGGVIAGIAILALSLLFLLYRHRRQRGTILENASSLEKNEINAAVQGGTSTPHTSSANDSPLPGQAIEENPEDTTRVLYTREGTRMTYVGSQDQIPSKASTFQRQNDHHQDMLTLPGGTTSDPHPPTQARSESPSHAGRDNSDLREQLEALRTEVQILRAQQTISGYEVPPPQYAA